MRPDFHSPAGTMTCPPPRMANWSMAFCMLPLVFRMLSDRSGNTGRCSCGMPSKVAPIGAMSGGHTFAPTASAVGICSVTWAEEWDVLKNVSVRRARRGSVWCVMGGEDGIIGVFGVFRELREVCQRKMS